MKYYSSKNHFQTYQNHFEYWLQHLNCISYFWTYSSFRNRIGLEYIQNLKSFIALLWFLHLSLFWYLLICSTLCNKRLFISKCINHHDSYFFYDLSALSYSHYLFLFILHIQTTCSVVPLPEARTSIHSIGSLGSPIHNRRPTISFLFAPDYLKNLSWWYLMVLDIYFHVILIM